MYSETHISKTRTEKRDRNWTCHICKKDFQFRYMLFRHNLRHTDERKFQCRICQKAFRLHATLIQHYSTHSTEKPFICKSCGKRFNRASSLISHFKIHAIEKKFKCHLCTKAFHQKGNLRNHLFSHTNERPYQCESCGRGFNQQSNLIYHVNRVHPEMSKLSNLNKNISSSSANTNEENYFGIIIDAVTNEHMENTTKNNGIPFAILNVKGQNPCIAKLMTTNMPKDKHMLLPVSASDISFYAQLTQRKDNVGGDNFFMQIPIVAIINFEGIIDGRYIFEIQPPHNLEIPSRNENNS